MNERSILFIGASEGDADKVQVLLRNAAAPRLNLHCVQTLFDGLRSLQERSFELIVSDLFLPDGPGVPTVGHLRQHAPTTPLIVFCHSKDRQTAVTAVRKGAYDFFCHEDLDPVNLRKSVEGALLHAGSESEKKAAAERRNNTRFPCRLAVSYQSLEHPILSGQGVSETLNISSKGLLFTSGEQLNEGQLVQVSLDWPARLENQIPLKLVAEGRVVRNDGGQTAMTIDKYEFRTRRTPARQPETAKSFSPAPSAPMARNIGSRQSVMPAAKPRRADGLPR